MGGEAGWERVAGGDGHDDLGAVREGVVEECEEIVFARGVELGEDIVEENDGRVLGFGRNPGDFGFFELHQGAAKFASGGGEFDGLIVDF